MVIIITAVCSTESCQFFGAPNTFEHEEELDFLVHCGGCKNEISDITVTEK
jgi:hypothetical protein